MSDQDAARRTIATVLTGAGVGPELTSQLEHATLEVSPSEVVIRPVEPVTSVTVADGPLEVTADVTAPDGEYLGEILVWVLSGRLASAEYAWVTDDPPGAWPDPERVTLAISQ